MSPGSRPSIMQTKRTAFTGIDIQGHQAVVVTGSSSTAATRVVPLDNLGAAIPVDARVSVAMPPLDCVCRWLTTPFTSSSKARKVLPTILDIQLPFPLEACVYDFVADRKSDEGHVEALALAARHRAVAGALAQWETHTVNPAVLDHEGLALWSQSLVEQPVSATQSAHPRVVVYAGSDRSCIVLGRGETFINSHSCMLEQPASLTRLLRAAFGESMQDLTWIWCGPHVGQAEFDETREAVEAIAPGGSAVVDQPHAFLARALYARIARPGRLACNFRSGVFADVRKDARSSQADSRMAIVMGVMGLLFWAQAGWSLHLASQARQGARTQFMALISRASDQPLGAAQGEQALSIARASLKQDAASFQPVAYAVEPSLTIALHRLIFESEAASLKIHEFRLSRTEWVLNGEAEQRDACDRLVEATQTLGYKTILTWPSGVAEGTPQPFVLSTEVGP
ncbi:MAG: hypothetical protein ACI9X0_002368 [Kiritimatiellia bacterium]